MIRQPRPKLFPLRLAALPAVTLAVLVMIVAACASTGAREGLDASRLPEGVRPDYALFARRCSKCHSLARALNSGIDDDARWVDYVTRMRRQPGSGILPQDTAPILRFLHYYSLEQRRIKRTRALASDGPSGASTGSSTPPAGAAPRHPAGPAAEPPAVAAPEQARDR